MTLLRLFFFGACFILFFSSCINVPEKPATLNVHTDFSGGSAQVELLDQTARLVRLVPTPHPDRGWDAWWYFRLDGIRPGETITLDVGKGIWATPNLAMFSLDNKTWQHVAIGKRDGDRIVYQQTIDARTAWFAWGPPFRLIEAKELIRSATKRCRYAKAITLTRSRENRAVPALRISEPGASDADRLGIWIHARQHAWESGSSWVAAGLVDWLTSDDSRAVALRQKSLITIVPVMDVDNVERGAGGKAQKPHDHNRDWSDKPHWPEVAAAMKEISALDSAGRFDLYVDLHNPGPRNKNPFFFMPPAGMLAPASQKNYEAFLEMVKSEMTGPLSFIGQTHANGPDYDANWERISSNWVRRNTREDVVGLCLETPWNTPSSTVDGYRQVGRELGQSIEKFFRTAGFSARRRDADDQD